MTEVERMNVRGMVGSGVSLMRFAFGEKVVITVGDAHKTRREGYT